MTKQQIKQQIMQHPTYDPCMTVQEAAAYLCMHPETLKDKMRLGEIFAVRTTVKKGSRVKFRLSVLNAWIVDHEVPVEGISHE